MVCLRSDWGSLTQSSILLDEGSDSDDGPLKTWNRTKTKSTRVMAARARMPRGSAMVEDGWREE